MFTGVSKRDFRCSRHCVELTIRSCMFNGGSKGDVVVVDIAAYPV